MSTEIEPRSASTIGELDVHLQYMRRELEKLVGAVAQMATKQDIRELEQRMSSFATKDELASLERRLGQDSLPNTFDRWLTAITKIGTAGGVIAGAAAAVAAFVHFLDKVPK